MQKLIAISGGPGAGKSTLVREIARVHGERVRVLPEVATSLLGNLFPSIESERQRRHLQRAIYAVQWAAESVALEQLAPDQVLVCDRGLIDGAAYWPGGVQAFFDEVGLDRASGLSRYPAAVFLQSAACGDHGVPEGNPVRCEDARAARQLDESLHELWKVHKQLFWVEQQPTPEQKLEHGLAAFERALAHVGSL